MSAHEETEISITQRSIIQDGQFIHKILHHKCPVVQLVREQMSSIDAKFAAAFETIKSCTGIRGDRKGKEGLWENRYYIASVALLVILMWFVFIYGAFMGASVCGSKRSSYSGGCGSTGLKIIPGFPGLVSTRNIQNVY